MHFLGLPSGTISFLVPLLFCSSKLPSFLRIHLTDNFFWIVATEAVRCSPFIPPTSEAHERAPPPDGEGMPPPSFPSLGSSTLSI